MDDYALDGRYKALREELRDLHDEVEKLRKKKANGADVEEIAKKVSDIESEMRNKFSELRSGNNELLEQMRKLTQSVESLRNDVSNQKNEVREIRETNKGSVWERIPVWAWVFMAIGLFAVLQLGLERYGELRNQGALP